MTVSEQQLQRNLGRIRHRFYHEYDENVFFYESLGVTVFIIAIIIQKL